MSMGSQPAGTSTATNLPPNYMLPYIGTGLNQAAKLLQSNTPQYYPGQTVAGLSPVQQKAMNAETALDSNLMQGSGNPYEDAMFQHAAEMSQNQLAGEFAGAGRNISASAPLRAEQLNNLANSFYGGQYQNDINNAMNAGQNWLGIGGMVQDQAQKLMDANKARFDYYQNLPYQELGNYQRLVGGFQTGGQTVTPYFSNPMGGALEGAALGSKIYPGWGTLIGAGVGALSGSQGGR